MDRIYRVSSHPQHSKHFTQEHLIQTLTHVPSGINNLHSLINRESQHSQTALTSQSDTQGHLIPQCQPEDQEVWSTLEGPKSTLSRQVWSSEPNRLWSTQNWGSWLILNKPCCSLLADCKLSDLVHSAFWVIHHLESVEAGKYFVTKTDLKGLLSSTLSAATVCLNKWAICDNVELQCGFHYIHLGQLLTNPTKAPVTKITCFSAQTNDKLMVRVFTHSKAISLPISVPSYTLYLLAQQIPPYRPNPTPNDGVVLFIHPLTRQCRHFQCFQSSNLLCFLIKVTLSTDNSN